MDVQNNSDTSFETKLKFKRRPNKIGLYLRGFSEDDSYIDYQEKGLRAEVDRINRTFPLGDIVAVFKDKGLDFDTFTRSGIKALMTAVTTAQINLVMVAEFRDLASPPADFIDLLKFLDRHRCALRNAREYLLYGDLGDTYMPPMPPSQTETWDKAL